MDEKHSDSGPSTETDENDSDATVASDRLDVPGPETAANGGWTFVTQNHYDPEKSRDLTTVVISAIADAEDVPVSEIKDPPLYEVVDIAGIEAALFGRPAANRSGVTSTVEFRYTDYRVRVEADGWVTVSNRSGDSKVDGE